MPGFNFFELLLLKICDLMLLYIFSYHRTVEIYKNLYKRKRSEKSQN